MKIVDKYYVEKNDKDEMGQTNKSGKEQKGPHYGQPVERKKETEIKSMYYTEAGEKQQKNSLYDDQKERDAR